jgi:hypothetical protein
MRLSKRKLQRIIREEVRKSLNEQMGVEKCKEIVQNWAREIGARVKTKDTRRGEEMICDIPRDYEYNGFTFIGGDNYFKCKHDGSTAELVVQMFIVPPNMSESQGNVNFYSIERSDDLKIAYFDLDSNQETSSGRIDRPERMSSLLQAAETYVDRYK